MYKIILYLFCCFYVIYNDSDLQANSKNNDDCNLIVLCDSVNLSNVH